MLTDVHAPRRLAAGVGQGLVAALFVFVVVVGLSGQLGVVLKGIRLTEPVAGSLSSAVVHLAIAAAATAGAFFAALPWRAPQAGSAARAGLVGLGVVVLVSAPRGTELVMVALPAVVAAVAVAVVAIAARVQEPLRKESAGDYLWTALLLASGYGLVAAIVT